MVGDRGGGGQGWWGTGVVGDRGGGRQGEDDTAMGSVMEVEGKKNLKTSIDASLIPGLQEQREEQHF